MMMTSIFSPHLIHFFFIIFLHLFPPQENVKPIMKMPGYPVVFDLNEGESFEFSGAYEGENIKKTVKLLSVKHIYEPNDWFQDSIPSKNLQEAIVEVEVSGIKATLIHRPYQMPVIVNGLRLYVETTDKGAGGLDRLKDIYKQIRYLHE
jgi:hypothetical protein